jgi:hypothetical protein
MELFPPLGDCAGMPDFPIDPELRIRASPELVLRRTSEALNLVREMTLSRSDRAWKDLLQSFDAIRDDWSAIEAVVRLELLLEAEGLLVEERPSEPLLPPDQVDHVAPGSRFAR